MIKTILKIRSQSSVKRKMLRNNIFFSRRKLPRKQMIMNVFRNSFKVFSPQIYPQKNNSVTVSEQATKNTHLVSQ